MQEKSLIKQNILKYLDFKGVTPYRFYKDSGVTRGVLTQNNGITEENLLKFLDFAQDISLDWLILGKGNMIKETDLKDHSNAVLPSECNENSLIAALKDIIKQQAKEIAHLEIELSKRQTNENP